MPREILRLRGWGSCQSGQKRTLRGRLITLLRFSRCRQRPDKKRGKRRKRDKTGGNTSHFWRKYGPRLVGFPAGLVKFPAGLVKFPADLVNFPADLVNFPADLVNFPADLVDLSADRVDLPPKWVGVPAISAAFPPQLVGFLPTPGEM